MELKIEVIESLKTLLADEYILSVRTQDAHRNMHGRNFMELRKLFEGRCESLDAIVVDVSQRVRALGEHALATFKHSMEATRLSRHNEKFKGQNQIIEALLDDHESIIHALSNEGPGAPDEKIDIGTADFS